MPTQTKQCNGCSLWLRPEEYHKDSTKSDGLATRCKQCRNASHRKRYKENREAILARNTARKLMKKYGLTVEQWNAMYEAQDGRCAICKRVPKRKLNVDHCHDSGRVRGLLCGDCNRALGLFRESAEVISTAALYVARNE